MDRRQFIGYGTAALAGLGLAGSPAAHDAHRHKPADEEPRCEPVGPSLPIDYSWLRGVGTRLRERLSKIFDSVKMFIRRFLAESWPVKVLIELGRLCMSVILFILLFG